MTIDLNDLKPADAAMIGYVPEHPDTVYLDYRHTCKAYMRVFDLGNEESFRDLLR